MTAVAEDLHGVEAVVDHLAQDPAGPVPDVVGPFLDHGAPHVRHLAVVEHGAAFDSGKVDQGVHPAACHLVHRVGMRFRGKGRFHLVEASGVTAVVEEKDLGFAVGRRVPVAVEFAGGGRRQRHGQRARREAPHGLQEVSTFHDWYLYSFPWLDRNALQ